MICRRQLVEYYRGCNSRDSSEKFENLVTKVKNVLRVQDDVTDGSKQ